MKITFVEENIIFASENIRQEEVNLFNKVITFPSRKRKCLQRIRPLWVLFWH